MESWIVRLESLRRLIFYTRLICVCYLCFLKFVKISVYLISLCSPSAYLNMVDEVMPPLSSRVLGDIGEMLPKFQQILKTQLTCTIQSSIKTSLLEWVRIPLVSYVYIYYIYWLPKKKKSIYRVVNIGFVWVVCNTWLK